MSVIIHPRGEAGGGVAAHLHCSHCGHFSKSHAQQLSHLAAAHPSCLDQEGVGRLGHILMYQSTARLFHCSVCFFTCRDFTKLYKHIISKHCMDDREGGGAGRGLGDEGEQEKGMGEEGEEEEKKKVGEEGEEEEKKVGEEGEEEEEKKKKMGDEGEEEEKKKGDEGEEEEEKKGDEREEEKKNKGDKGEEEEMRMGDKGEEEEMRMGDEGEEKEKKMGDEGEEEEKKKKMGDKGEEEEMRMGDEGEEEEKKKGDEGEEEEKKMGDKGEEEEMRMGDEGEEEEKKMGEEGEEKALKRKRSSEEEGQDEDGAPRELESEKPDGEGEENILTFDGSIYHCLICGCRNKLKVVSVNHVMKKHDIPKAYASQALRRDVVTFRQTLSSSPEEDEAAGLTGELLNEEMKAMAKVVTFTSNRFVCLICGWKTKLKGFAISHVARSHEVERPFSCRDCSCSFFLPSRLQQHVRTAHRPGRYACPFCCFRSHYLGGFRRHCSRCNAREEGEVGGAAGAGVHEEQEEHREGGEEERKETRAGRKRRVTRKVTEEQEEDE